MPFYGLIDPQTGELISTGSEAMFAGGKRPVGSVYDRYEIVDFGDVPPDFSAKLWEAAGRRLIDRPAPILISRLDDIDGLLLADPDFSKAWAALSATRKTQVRIGLRRVLGQVLGASQWRGETESVEV